MAFEPENDLERALMRAPSEPAARPEFYRLLLESPLFVLGDMSGGNSMRLGTVRHGEHEYHLVFSALSRLQAFVAKPENYLELKGRDLFSAARGAYFMLNPGADYGKELLPDEIAHLLDPKPSHREVTVEKETQVLIGQAKDPPTALMEALATAFRARPDVLTAYIAQIHYPDPDEKPHPLIGVEALGAWEPVSAEIGRVVDGLHLGLTVDAVPIVRGASNNTLSDALLRYPPFYKRELPVT